LVTLSAFLPIRVTISGLYLIFKQYCLYQIKAIIGGEHSHLCIMGRQAVVHYLDGNGRMGKFIMNLMMAAGGYPWTIVPVTRRDEYM